MIVWYIRFSSFVSAIGLPPKGKLVRPLPRVFIRKFYVKPSAIPGAHRRTAGIAPTTSIAHKGAVVGAKVMADSILDFAHLGGVARSRKKAIRRGH
jgi:hypothetical protein